MIRSAVFGLGLALGIGLSARRAAPPQSASYYVDHQMPKAVGDLILAANGIAPPAAASRGAIMLSQGDTISPLYAIRTDTVLGVITVVDSLTLVPRGAVVAKKCGTSAFFLRIGRRKGQMINPILTADTVTVSVTSCTTAVPSSSFQVAMRLLSCPDSSRLFTKPGFPPADTTINPLLAWECRR
ncbi:MAG: hypothetical protein LUO93_06130 [Methanomicrobiales archaeon]|nr:hypothetical protein [Methanomicrobiales archaeon]